MNNVVLTVVLGMGLAVCLAASYMAYGAGEEEKRINEQIHYAEAGLDESTMFGGYSYEQISEGYLPPVKEHGHCCSFWGLMRISASLRKSTYRKTKIFTMISTIFFTVPTRRNTLWATRFHGDMGAIRL